MAVEAEIPLLPIQFTGGAARNARPTTDVSLAARVERLQTLTGNIDQIGSLVTDIVQKQAILQRAKSTPLNR